MPKPPPASRDRPRSTRQAVPAGTRTPCDAAESVAVERRRDNAMVRALVAWFRTNARPLPWRTTPRRPWPSLVSEVMAQQTQIARVVEKYQAFLDVFPSPALLAAAPESEVLAAWSGLGYYRRARLLQRAARAIADVHGGIVPAEVKDLLALPGVGRYTAGAIASIVFGKPAPIVDGNVSRVLLRLRARDSTAAQAAPWAWDEAGRLAGVAGAEVAEFNEGLMELGALVCTPRSPACHQCPLAELCQGKARGLQEQIPRPKSPPARTTIRADVMVIRDSRGRLLVERRPADGLWASMWQAPTRETAGPSLSAGPIFEEDPTPALASNLGLGPVSDVVGPREFTHDTSHRRVEFRVWTATGSGRATRGRRWLAPEELVKLPLANPQRTMLLGPGPGHPPTRAARPRTLRQ